MAFVREDVPEEYMKEHDIEQGNGWHIDRERDAIFYWTTGGNPRGCETAFLLVWKGEKIKVGSRWYENGIGKDKIIEWRDTYVAIPEHLESQRQEILTALVEAFACYGLFGSGKYRTKVVFDPKMQFRERV